MFPDNGDKPNYIELVFHVLRDAHAPLTLDEIVAGVQDLAAVHAANPKALIAHIVEQANLIQPTPDGRYGYLPFLLEGNAFRQGLPPGAIEQRFFELSPDALTALWPGWLDTLRLQETRPANALLPDGQEAQLERHARAAGRWGLSAGPAFWTWLRAAGAQPGDDLMIRVVDADLRSYALDLECAACRNPSQVAGRNEQVGDLAVLAVQGAGGEILISRLAPMLIAAGAYRDPTPPDPLITVLAQDGRFVDAGLGVVALQQGWTEADERQAEMRQQLMGEVSGEMRPRFRRAALEAEPKEEQSTLARLVLEDRLEEAVAWLQRENRIHTDEQGNLRVDLQGLLDDPPAEEGRDRP